MNTPPKSTSSTYKRIFCVSCAFSPALRPVHRSFSIGGSILCVVGWLFFLGANSASAYSGGNGYHENPYQIADANNLLELGADVNNYDKFFILTTDINLAGYDFNNAVIAPGDNYSPAFVGSFDGACHKISNLTITAGENPSYLGLFGKTVFAYLDDYGYYWSEIKNLTLENVRITTNNTDASAGGLVGDNDGVPITNCQSTVIFSGNNPVCLGGLVGWNYYGIISNCSSGGVIAISSDFSRFTGWPDAGGLVGWNNGSIITDSYSYCNIIADGNFLRIGGLVGANENYYGAPGSIINCYSTGTIRISNAQILFGAGGLVGSNGTGATIRNCYSVGEVNISGSGSVGGLAGTGYQNDINSCYFLNTSGPDNDLGEPLNDAQMKQQASFVGWDFLGETINGTQDVWWILENITYPKLNWQRILPSNPCGPGAPGNGGIYSADYDFDNFINFVDFAFFANAWLTENPFISLDNDIDVDIDDLKIFCDYWLTYTDRF